MKIQDADITVLSYKLRMWEPSCKTITWKVELF